MQDSILKDQKIDLQEAASLLGVSSATVKNWIGHSYLTPDAINTKKVVFDYLQVKALKEKIATGEVNRLNKRANKKNSSATFIPEEYAQNEIVLGIVQEILARRADSTNSKKLIFLVAINLLRDKGLIQFSNPLDLASYTFTNQAVKDEVGWWFANTKQIPGNYNNLELLDLKLPQVSDLLGLLYQSLTAEGEKSQAGSYYTPKSIVDEIVDECIQENFVILDPCCGTGQFLLSVADKLTNPSDIWGFDIDEVAVRIARLNLLLRFSDRDFTPHIYRKNTLLEVGSYTLFSQNDIPPFDAIITNPPWGYHFSESESEQLRTLHPLIKSNEAFSYFLDQSLRLLKKGGTLSFILPESILNVKTHKDIRQIILEESRITKIKFLDRAFKNVFSPVIRLDLLKVAPKPTDTFEAKKTENLYIVEQSRLKNNQDFLFDVFTDDKDMVIFKKIFDLHHTTLEDQADWALGIVTGDNDKHLLDQQMEGCEPILTGKDIRRFATAEPKKFIKFNPDNFQQVAPVDRYRIKEKLIYKFISRDLVFSYDNGQTLTLNSANILIPRIPDYPIKTILAILNSSLFQFIHQKKFGSLKVLRGDLEKLPMPFLEKSCHLELEERVDDLLDRRTTGAERQKKYLELDSRIMDFFSLSKEERSYIGSNVKMSDKALTL